MAITAKDHYVKKEFHMMNADDWDALKYACTFGYFGGTIKPTKSKARPRTVKVRSHTRSYTQRELNA
jgi:transcriptional antiterminator Rof (Rho-off)